MAPAGVSDVDLTEGAGDGGECISPLINICPPMGLCEYVIIIVD